MSRFPVPRSQSPRRSSQQQFLSPLGSSLRTSCITVVPVASARNMSLDTVSFARCCCCCDAGQLRRVERNGWKRLHTLASTRTSSVISSMLVLNITPGLHMGRHLSHILVHCDSIPSTGFLYPETGVELSPKETEICVAIWTLLLRKNFASFCISNFSKKLSCR